MAALMKVSATAFRLAVFGHGDVWANTKMGVTDLFPFMTIL